LNEPYNPEWNKELRLGVLGCSAIVPRAVLEPLRHVENVRVVSLANRTLIKAERMAELYGICRTAALGELVEDASVDAVYLALSNELHANWAIKAMEAGKHVLVEKPLCLTKDEAERLRQTANQTGVRLQEGLMVRCHPWQKKLKELIDSGRYGSLRRIETRITQNIQNRYSGNYRSVKAKGGGCFADLGCYWLQFLQALIGLDWNDWRGESEYTGPGGCDWTFKARVSYPNGVEAECLTSFELPYKAYHRLVLDEAVLTIPDFFRPNLGFYKLTIQIKRRDGLAEVPTVFEPMSYYVNQLREFRDIVLDNGKSEHAAALERFARFETIIRDAESRCAIAFRMREGEGDKS